MKNTEKTVTLELTPKEIELLHISLIRCRQDYNDLDEFKKLKSRVRELDIQINNL